MERVSMFKRQDDSEIECLSGELMHFDMHDGSVEELERRLEMTIASFIVLAADCPLKIYCTANCTRLIIVPPKP
jgi:hypothetical protein